MAQSRFTIQTPNTTGPLVSAPVSRTAGQSAPARPTASGGFTGAVASGLRSLTQPPANSYQASLLGNTLSQAFPGYNYAPPTAPRGGGSGDRPAPNQRQLPTSSGSFNPYPEVSEQEITQQMIADEVVKQAQIFLDELQRRGQTINPFVEITPEKVAEFTAQAEKELGPYYAEQLKLAREEFLKELGYAQEDIIRIEQDLERKYGRQVRQLGSELAETGFAQSGRRLLQEQDLAYETQQAIQDKRRETERKLGLRAGEFTKQYGSEALKDTQAPQIGPSPRALPGEMGFDRTGESRPLYNLSPAVYGGLVGEKEFEKRGSIKTRSSELEEAYRTREADKQRRSLLL